MKATVAGRITLYGGPLLLVLLIIVYCIAAMVKPSDGSLVWGVFATIAVVVWLAGFLLSLDAVRYVSGWRGGIGCIVLAGFVVIAIMEVFTVLQGSP